MSTEKSTLDAMLEQHARANAPKYTKQEAKVYDEKNYFSTFIPESATSGTKTIRILPIGKGVSPFVEVYTHEGYVDGKKRTFACLQEEKGESCPFCEARDLLLATGKEEDKKTANKYRPRKVYIVKVIDRDHEDEGVKFWRIKENYKKEGAYDKIFAIINALKKDLSDPEIGRDLMITISRNDKGCVVSGIASLDPTPLSEDATKKEAWLSDKRTWEDVYSIKNYDYLRIIVMGGNPVWDSETKSWVDKTQKTTSDSTSDIDEDINDGLENIKSNIKTSTTSKSTKTSKSTPAPINVAEESSDDSSDDDLPF